MTRRAPFAALLCACLTSCGDAGTGPVQASTVEVTPPTVDLDGAGATAQLSAVARDAEGTSLPGKSFTWTSSAPGVAMVDAAGLVTAVAGGVATISASVDGRTGSASATVTTGIPVEAGFAQGDYWEYFWTWESENFAQGSGTTFDVEVGSFRVTLGPATSVAGVTVHPLEIEGTTDDGVVDFAPEWTHLGATVGGSLVGSRDGAMLHYVYDARTRTWSGGGYFVAFPDDQEVAARTGSFPGVYNQVSAVVVSREVDEGGCTFYSSVGQTVCAGDPLSIDEREYYKAGLGPVGYFFESRVTFTGGGFTTSHRNTRTLELIGSSLTADDGTTFRRPPWEEVAPLAVARQDHAAATYAGKIYVFGGWTGSAPLASTEIYDPETDSWSFGARLPVPLIRASATTVGDRIYVVPTTESPIRIYDPVADSWATGRDVPYADPSHGTCAVTLPIGRRQVPYVASISPDGALNSTLFAYLYDVGQDLWLATTNPLATTDQRWFSVACHESDVYMVGGYRQFVNGGSAYAGLRRYDPPTATWMNRAAMPTARYSTASVVLDGEIVTLGGTDGSQELRTVEAYDPEVNAWRSLPLMLRPRDSFAAVVVDGRLYAIGGDSGESTSAKVEAYTPPTGPG